MRRGVEVMREERRVEQGFEGIRGEDEEGGMITGAERREVRRREGNEKRRRREVSRGKETRREKSKKER